MPFGACVKMHTLNAMNDFHVYMNPRNDEEFYFGKGRGSRKHAQLSGKPDSEKAHSRTPSRLVRQTIEPYGVRDPEGGEMRSANLCEGRAD